MSFSHTHTLNEALLSLVLPFQVRMRGVPTVSLVSIGPSPTTSFPHKARPAQFLSAARRIRTHYNELTGVIPDAKQYDFSTIGYVLRPDEMKTFHRCEAAFMD